MQGQAPTMSLKNKITGVSQVSSLRIVSDIQGPFNPPYPLSSLPPYSRVYSSLSEMEYYINANLFRFFVEEIVGHHALLPLDRRTL
jgi:hypothetical protein